MVHDTTQEDKVNENSWGRNCSALKSQWVLILIWTMFGLYY